MTEDERHKPIVPHVGQQTFKLLKDSWCYNKYYATIDGINYLRNDGKVFNGMQQEVTDLNGGTYFLTQQDAQNCLDRYNATQNAANQDTQT